MKRFKTLVLLILTVLLVAGVLCGCAVQTGEQPGISSLPQITIGSDTYPPFVYLDNNGDPTGIDVEIAVEAFRRMGYQAWCLNHRLGAEKDARGQWGDRLYLGLFLHGWA